MGGCWSRARPTAARTGRGRSCRWPARGSGGRPSPLAAARSGSQRRSTTTSCGRARWTGGGRSRHSRRSTRRPRRAPSIAATGAGTAYLAWIDTRGPLRAGSAPAGRALRRWTGGPTPQSSRLDSTAAPNQLAQTLDNAWAPSVSATAAGCSSRGPTSAATTGASTRASLPTAARRSTRSAPSPTRPPLRRRWTTRRVRPLRPGGPASCTAWAKSDASASRPQPALRRPHRFTRRALQARRRRRRAVFQRVRAGGGGAPRRLAGHGARRRRHLPGARRREGSPQARAAARRGNQWRPALAISRSRAVVAWEDDRDGPSQIYVRRIRPPK